MNLFGVTKLPIPKDSLQAILHGSNLWWPGQLNSDFR